jgi:hypothetical protein
MNTKKAPNAEAPAEVLETLQLSKGTTIGVAFFHVLQLLAERPEQHVPAQKDERLREILEHARVFLLPEHRESLIKAGYLPPIAGPTSWTPEQMRAHSRVNAEILAKLFDDDIPTGNPLLHYSSDELLQAVLQKLEQSTGVSERLREAAGELAAAMEAEARC